ncbi:MAG: hypothetical protein KJ638_07650, partial [Chloroflexi bacterium]|nr:hypothetical protein [Chloroflexota bacterium]
MNIYESKNAVKRTLQTLAFATMAFVLLTGCAPATPSATETPIATGTEITDADAGESVSVTPTAMEERWEIRTSEDAISEEFLSGTGRVGVELEIDYPQGADDRVIFEAVVFDDNGNLVVVMGNLWKKVDGSYVQLKEIKGTVDGV